MYLKTGGPTGKMTVVYVVKLNLSASEFLKRYQDDFMRQLNLRGELPEFGELLTVQAIPESIEEFIEQNKDRLNEYMAVTLRQAQRDFA